MIRPTPPRLNYTHKRHAPLSIAEEQVLAIKIRQGDRVALDRLVNANMKFAVSVARQFVGLGIPLEDLVNEGAMGLVRAAHRFEPGNGFRFVSYAVWWIRQAITYSLQHQTTTIRTPDLAACRREMKEATQDLEKALASGIEKEIEKAEKAYKKVSKRDEEIKFLRSMSSLDQLQEGEKDAKIDPASAWVKPAAVEDVETPEDRVQARETKERVARLIASLPEIDRDIVSRLFGLESGEPETLQQVGDAFGLSRERIRQRQKRALFVLKYRLKGKVIR